MTNYVVSGGTTTSSSIRLVTGDTMSVFSGGTADATKVSSGGVLSAYSGGIVNSAKVFVGGDMSVFAGGSASGTVIESGATMTVSSGGAVDATSVTKGSLTLDGGTQATSTTIATSATFIVHSGAVASVTSVGGHSILEVSGGTLDTVSMGTSATLEVFGGTLDSVTIHTGSNGRNVVYAGGVISDATFDSGTDLVISSGGAVHTATMTVHASTETVMAGGSADFSTVGKGSIITVSSGGTVANLTETVSGTVHLDAGAIASGFIDLTASSSTLIIDGATMPGATISGFVAHRTIELGTLTSSAGAAAHLGAGNVLSVTDGASTYLLQLDPVLNYGAATFALTASGGAMVLTTTQPPCFLAGTLIDTEQGPLPVESLQPGQRVRIADGGVRPVRWLGVSSVATHFADPLRVLPIRIRAGALGEGLPARDLLLSPGHAVRIGGVLAHAGALVNGLSIVRDAAMPERFCYYHVELDTHALLLAEGVAAESYLEDEEPLAFDNRATRIPPAEVAELPYPRAKSARQVPRAERERLEARARYLFSRRAAA